MRLDQVLGLAAGTVDVLVEPPRCASEVGDDEPAVTALRRGLDPGDDLTLDRPGSAALAELAVATDLHRLACNSAHRCLVDEVSDPRQDGMVDGDEAAGSVALAPRGQTRRSRRSWSAETKRRIVQETLQCGASVAVVAQRHGINANLVFKWRRTAGISEPAASPVPVVAPSALDVRRLRAAASSEPPEFLPIGVFGRAEDEGPAMLVTAPSRVARSLGAAAGAATVHG